MRIGVRTSSHASDRSSRKVLGAGHPYERRAIRKHCDLRGDRHAAGAATSSASGRTRCRLVSSASSRGSAAREVRKSIAQPPNPPGATRRVYASQERQRGSGCSWPLRRAAPTGHLLAYCTRVQSGVASPCTRVQKHGPVSERQAFRGGFVTAADVARRARRFAFGGVARIHAGGKRFGRDARTHRPGGRRSRLSGQPAREAA